MWGQSQPILLIEESKDREVLMNIFQLGSLGLDFLGQLLLDLLNISGGKAAWIAQVIKSATPSVLMIMFAGKEDSHGKPPLLLFTLNMKHLVATFTYLIPVVTIFPANVAPVGFHVIIDTFQTITEIFCIIFTFYLGIIQLWSNLCLYHFLLFLT